jgi:hypothetical protein
MKPKSLALAAFVLLLLLAAGSAQAEVACPHPGAAALMTSAVQTAAAPTLADALGTPKPVFLTTDCCRDCTTALEACLASCGPRPACKGECYGANRECTLLCPTAC